MNLENLFLELMVGRWGLELSVLFLGLGAGALVAEALLHRSRWWLTTPAVLLVLLGLLGIGFRLGLGWLFSRGI